MPNVINQVADVTNETKGMLLGIIGVTAFGFTLPATKIAILQLSPIFVGLGRSVFAVIIVLPLLLFFAKKLPTKKQFALLVVVSLGVVIGFPLFSTLAMSYAPASHGAIVLGITPLATTVVGVIISKERPSSAFWLVSLLGTSLVVFYALWKGAGELQMGDLALLAAIIAVSIGYAIGAQLSKELGGWQVICWAVILAFPMIIFPTIHFSPASFVGISADTVWSFLYLAIVSQLLAFFVWYKGLALGGISRVSQVQLLQVFITIFASVILLDEKIDTITIIFAVLVISTVWVGKKMPVNETRKDI